MTLKRRRRIFYGLVAAFFILGAGVVLYVNGWRLDFKTFSLKKVGAIYLRSFPKEAKIFLDKKPIENASGLLQSGTLINGLFPKTYELKLEADGYEPWRENVSVLPALVSEVKYAVLVPEQATAIATGTIHPHTTTSSPGRLSSVGVKNFWLMNNLVATQTEENKLSLADQKIGDGEIMGSTKDFKDLLIFNSKTDSRIMFNTDTGKKINIDSVLKKTGVQRSKIIKLIVDPENNGDLLIQEQKRISILDTEKQSAAVIYKLSSGEISSVIPATQSLIVWSEFDAKKNTSLLTIYDRFLKRNRYGSPTFAGRTLELAWLPTKKIAVREDNGGFYLYDVDKNESTKIADDVKSFTFSKDADFLATLENSSLEIFSLAESGEYHRFNLPNVSQAQEVIWYLDNNHLFVVYPDRLAFLDINDSGLRNFTTVANGAFPRYDEKNNQLYFLNEGGVERLDFPK